MERSVKIQNTVQCILLQTPKHHEYTLNLLVRPLFWKSQLRPCFAVVLRYQVLLWRIFTYQNCFLKSRLRCNVFPANLSYMCPEQKQLRHSPYLSDPHKSNLWTLSSLSVEESAAIKRDCFQWRWRRGQTQNSHNTFQTDL